MRSRSHLSAAHRCADPVQARECACLECMTENFGAGNETRTRDPDLGKVVLYQLSYSRASRPSYDLRGACQLFVAIFLRNGGKIRLAKPFQPLPRMAGQAARRYSSADQIVS